MRGDEGHLGVVHGEGDAQAAFVRQDVQDACVFRRFFHVRDGLEQRGVREHHQLHLVTAGVVDNVVLRPQYVAYLLQEVGDRRVQGLAQFLHETRRFGEVTPAAAGFHAGRLGAGRPGRHLVLRLLQANRQDVVRPAVVRDELFQRVPVRGRVPHVPRPREDFQDTR